MLTLAPQSVHIELIQNPRQILACSFLALKEICTLGDEEKRREKTCTCKELP